MPAEEIATLRHTLDPEDSGSIEYKAVFRWFKNLNNTLDQNEASLSSGIIHVLWCMRVVVA